MTEKNPLRHSQWKVKRLNHLLTRLERLLEAGDVDGALAALRHRRNMIEAAKD